MTTNNISHSSDVAGGGRAPPPTNTFVPDDARASGTKLVPFEGVVTTMQLASYAANRKYSGSMQFNLPARRALACLRPVSSYLFCSLAMSLSAILATPAEAASRKTRSPAGGTVSMETAVRSAARQHPAIAEATGTMLQMREQIAVARAGYYPKISGGVASGHDPNNNQGWRPALNVSASQMIYDFGKVSSEVDMASAGARASQAQVAITTDVIARDTALAYIEAQRFQSLLGVAVEQLTSVRDIGALVQMRATDGASSMSDREQAEARILATEATKFEVEGERARWLGNLAYLSGLPVAGVTSAAPNWLRSACSGGDPNWSIIPAAVQANENRLKAIAALENSNSRLYPTLSLQGGADYNPFYKKEPDYSYASNMDNRRFNYSGGLRVSGDLYEGGANIARRRAANHALTASMAADAAVRLQVRQDLAQARTKVIAIVAQLRAVKLRDAAMVKTRDLYQQQYVDLGTRTLLDVLNSEQELYAVRFQAVNLAYDQRRLHVECLYNRGLTSSSFALAPEAQR